MSAITPIVVANMQPPSLAGFTRRVFVENDQYSIFGYIRPDAETDGVFKMWDQDNSEWLFINGWLFETWDDSGARDDEHAEARQLGLTAL